MQLIVQDEDGRALSSHTDYSLDLQYGDDKCDFVLYVPNVVLQARQRILMDGTPFGGIIDRKCPSRSAKDGDLITFKGRTVQGVLKKRVIEPPAGKSHLTLSGDANRVLEGVIALLGLDGFFEVPSASSGLEVRGYSFYRFVDAWTGLRMMAASVGGRISITCHDGRHAIRVVERAGYGQLASEQTYFDLDLDCLPVNHLIGLGSGQGVERQIVHWYADALGRLSQTQTLFGIYENAETYNLNSEEGEELSSKTKAKLKELQQSSEASLKLPPGVSVDVGDVLRLSNARFGIDAEAEVVQVVLQAGSGTADVSYKFGIPDYPTEEE